MKYSKPITIVWFSVVVLSAINFCDFGYQDRYFYDSSHRRVKFNKPGFDLFIQPAALFPNTDGAEVKIEEWENNEICVRLQSNGHTAAEVRIEITNELTVPIGSVADFEINFAEALFNENTAVREDKELGVKVYSGLNWIALIKWFGKDNSVSFSGRDWYKNCIEPYIRKGGVSLIGLFGSCIGDDAIYRFYQTLGFSGKVVIGMTDENYTIDEGPVRIKPVFFSLKALK